jgi:hypothetical protein
MGILLMVGMILNTYVDRNISSRRLGSLHDLEAWSKAFIQKGEGQSDQYELIAETYADKIRKGIQLLTPSWITTFMTIAGIFLLAWFSYKFGVSSK